MTEIATGLFFHVVIPYTSCLVGIPDIPHSVEEFDPQNEPVRSSP